MDARIETFFKSMPIFDQFAKKDKLKKVDAVGSIEEVHERACKVF